VSAITLYIKEIKTRKRLRRQYALQNLREYMRSVKEEDIAKEIMRMTDINDIKILWEAGLTQILQKAASTRIEELIKRRSE